MTMTHVNFISKAQLLGIMCLIAPALSIFDPSFLTSPKNQTVCEDSTVIQECQISRGKSCLWFLNGTRIHDVCKIYTCQGNVLDGECAIEILNANPLTHSGIWQCAYYTNDNGSEEVTSKSEEAYLSVLGFPVAPKISGTINGTHVAILQEITYTEKDHVQLKCTAQCSRTPTKFTWYISDQPSSIDTANVTAGVLKETESVYVNLNDTSNAGSILKCGVKHYSETQELQTSPLILDFQYATNSVNLSTTGRQIVAKGTRTVYKCIANGNPAPQCEWLMWPIGGTQLITVQALGSCNYIIESFASSNEGRYTCLAENSRSTKHILSADVLFLIFGERIRNKVAIVGGVIGGLLGVVIIGMTITIIALRRRGERPKFGQQMLPALRTPEYKRKFNAIESENDYLSPSIRSAGDSVRNNRKDSDSDTIYEEIAEKNTIYLGVISDQSSA